MNPDPENQDIYIKPLMSTAWHLWKAGSELSVCGLPWRVAAMAWDSTTERPAEGVCAACAEGADRATAP